MAIPDPTVGEILATLAETPLQSIAIEARAAVAALPQRRRDNPQERLAAAEEQLEAVSRAASHVAKQELMALDRLVALADEIGVSPKVKVLLNEERGEVVELTSTKRQKALRAYIQALEEAIVAAHIAIGAREIGPLP